MSTKPSMIDREEIVDFFHELMQPNSDIRVMRLLGGAKMGKSHLLTKVLPKLIQEQYDVPFALVDMRRGTKTIPEYLHLLSTP